MNARDSAASTTSKDSQTIFRNEHRKICKRTDKLIAMIMCLQWPAAVIAALVISPRTWNASASSLHPHVVVALYLGGLITILPVFLAFASPGEWYTRHTIAACQMLMSGLLIHVSDGHIETHFHVFGSLAFLAFYLDWHVILTATLVTLLDHSVMGYYAPLSMFGTATAVQWRYIEHVLWVVFCDCFLVTSCIQSLKGVRTIALREASQDDLLHQAYHDSLTGLGNRMLMHKKMGQMLETASRQQSSFVLMAIDLDRFKEVNDTLGHQAGDALLRHVGERLQGLIRKEDILARVGGDEFALVIAECQQIAVAEKIAQRIIEVLNQPFQCGEHTVQVGVSIGICLYPDAGQSAEDLFHHADLALYKVKNSGCNTFLVFDEQMRADTLMQMSLEHRLRTAVQEQKFHINYQPIVNTSGRLLGFEALLRWLDPVHGSVSPAEFIPIAERTGVIVPLGAWVLREACSQAAHWHRTGHQFVKMSVNVSSLQLAHRDFVATVLAALKDSGLPAEMLDLELTESVLIENDSDSHNALELLRKFGVRFSIDDFGTGYSSLSYLRDLPVQTLKIDQTFVKEIANSTEARMLVEGMIEMAHSLHLKVVAEGVESREQMEILSAASCDEIQGFHISRAVTPHAAGEFMTTASVASRVSKTRASDGFAIAGAVPAIT